MPLSDLAQAVPGLILIGLLPGFALATLAAPRWAWWERLAMAPALSAGVAGVLGFVDHRLHVGFRVATVLPVLAVLAAAAAARQLTTRRAGAIGVAGDRRAVLTVTGVALAAGVAASVVLCSQLRAAPLPLDRDSAVHGTVAAAIAATGDTTPTIAEPVDGSAWSRIRTGLEAEAALVSEVGGPAAPSALLPLTLLAVLLLPLAVAALAWEASGSAWVGSVAAAFALLTALPAWPISAGELPLVMTTGLVVPLVLAAWRGVRGEGVAEAAAVAAACVGADWAVHGTEWVTATLVGAPLLAGALWASRRAGAVRGGALVLAAGGAAAMVVGLLTPNPAIAPSVPVAGGGALLPESSDFSALVGHRSLGAAWDELTGFQPAWQLLGLLVIAGAVAALRQRRMRWAMVAELAILAVYVDSVSVGVLRPVWVRLYPWSTDDRVMQMQVFTLAPLAAFGAVALAEWIARQRRAAVYRGLAALCAAGAALLGLSHAQAIYADALDRHPVITTTDVRVLSRMAADLPASAVVLSDDTDAGVWIPALTPQRLYMTWGYLRNHPDDGRISELSRACADPQRLNTALFAGIDAVYVGARPMPGMPPWDAACIARVPWLHLAIQEAGPQGTATVFTVDRRVAAARPAGAGS